MKKLSLLLILTITFFTFALQAQTPAFPTAEGFGKYATGGRGGKVVFVENLDDYIAYQNIETPIPGSFRWALTQHPGEPLTVIFRVSGTIMLKPYIVSGKNQNDIRSSRAKLTIAGQTAPGEGITIRNSKVNLGGSTDLIVRNVRFRIGENAADSTFIPGAAMGCENALRAIFDHCVFGWSGEENITMYDNRFTTVQWSVIHEGLYDDGHGKGNRGYGGQCGGASATWHHNLFAHNYSRSPRLNGARTDNEVKVFIEFINNVNYNWGRSGAPYGGELFTGTVRSHTANFVGNYYKPGPGTDANKLFFNLTIVPGANNPQWHVAGNHMAGSSTLNTDNWLGFANKPADLNTIKSDTLLFPPLANVFSGAWIGYAPYKINIETAEDAYQSVVAKAGTINRDSVERRIIREVTTGTAIFKASQGKWGIIDHSYNVEGYLDYPTATAPVDNDRDGMDDAWEIANGLDPTDSNDGNKVTLSGYTALEVYLNSLVGEKIDLVFNTGLKPVANPLVSIKQSGSFVSISSDTEISEISVYDISGKYRSEILFYDSNYLDLSNLNKGIYFLHIKTIDSKINIFKILKN